jgi:hypothetical protein
MSFGYPFQTIVFFYYPIHISGQFYYPKAGKVTIGCLSHFSHN